jgi:hypothetical protein
MEYSSPLLRPEIIRTHNYLGVEKGITSQELWTKAQQWCLGFAHYCAENGLPPQAVAFHYGVLKECDNHQQAAFWAAANVVSAYIDADMGGDI